MLEHADLPPILVLDVPSGLLPRDRLRIDDGAAAPLDDDVWQREIVAETGIQLDVVLRRTA